MLEITVSEVVGRQMEKGGSQRRPGHKIAQIVAGAQATGLSRWAWGQMAEGGKERRPTGGGKGGQEEARLPRPNKTVSRPLQAALALAKNGRVVVYPCFRSSTTSAP
jgi:hypothetical protein